jgi:hypothetical protein
MVKSPKGKSSPPRRVRSPSSGVDDDYPVGSPSGSNKSFGGASSIGGTGFGSGCLSWHCLGIVCLLIFTNVVTSCAWVYYMRTSGVPGSSGGGSSGPLTIGDEIASILKMSMQSSQPDSSTTARQDISQLISETKLIDPTTSSTPKKPAGGGSRGIIPGTVTVLSGHRGRDTSSGISVEPPPSNPSQADRIKPNGHLNVAPIPKTLLAKYTNVAPTERIPVLGKIPTNGTKPLWGFQHKGEDAIFALATNYPTLFYKRFVGSLRKSKYEGDIVLAVSPPDVMKDGVQEYLKNKQVLAYPFEVVCQGVDNCMFKENFLGYPDPRPMRTFANIRYALYEYWLTNYHFNSYILILDFRDTFFQLDPFATFGAFDQRQPKYELHMYEENFKVRCLLVTLFVSIAVVPSV